VLETLGVRRRTFDPGEVVVDESSPADCLGLVVDGHLHVYDSAFKGRRHLVRIVPPGQTVGTTLVVMRRTKVPALVTSHGESAVLAFPLARIRRVRGSGLERRFFENLNALVAEELLASWRKISILSCSDIAERFMLYLRDRSEREGSKTVAIGATEAEFADYLGVSRASLARVVRKLAAEGRFTYQRDVFTLR